MDIHADDYGITLSQAKAILALSDDCEGDGALSSVSIFVNSPCFEEAAALILPYVDAGSIDIALHLNIVEGAPCADIIDVPDLINDRRMFCHNFMGHLAKLKEFHRKHYYQQLVCECKAQLSRYFQLFPKQKDTLRLDSHQHTHAIPEVLDALLEAVEDEGAVIRQMRMPVENLAPFKELGYDKDIPASNKAKNVLLSKLCKHMPEKLPATCSIPAFTGVAFSGCMYNMTKPLAEALEKQALAQGKGLEVLFHPVSVPIDECLDPENGPFAEACSMPTRDKEADTVRNFYR